MAMQASGNKKIKIWMEGVKCRGHEMTLEDCKFNNWQNKECSTKNVVSVKCEPGNYVQQSKILKALKWADKVYVVTLAANMETV